MKSKVLLFEISLGCIIGFFVVFSLTKEKKDFADFALGKETSSYYAKDQEVPIHIGKMVDTEIEALISGWESRGKKEVILVLGNSQTHGVNQYKDGEKSYNHLLFDRYQGQYDVITQSLPNASLQELFLAFEYWQTQLPIKMLIVPTFMDDMRENGIRVNWFSFLANQDFQIKDDYELSSAINNDLGKIRTREIPENDNFQALDKTVQERSERALNDELNKRFSVWENRPNLRGQIFTNLYYLRNTILGISAQTKRKMIPKLYKKNFSAVSDIISSASNAQIELLLYIPPIRSDVTIPYDALEYDSFKKEMEHQTSSNSLIHFYNFEGLIPGELWGVKSATNLFGEKELDFMHFKAKGHQILFQNLSEAIDNHL